MPDFKNKPNDFIEKDGKTNWISRSLAVVVTIILNDKKVLLVKRGSKISESNKWCNPCGYLDWDESGTQCAFREVWEESGFDISNLIDNPDCITFQSLLYPWDCISNPEINHTQDVALFYGVFFNSESDPILSIGNCEDGEILEAKWVKIDELHLYDFAFKHDDRIKKYLNYKNK